MYLSGIGHNIVLIDTGCHADKSIYQYCSGFRRNLGGIKIGVNYYTPSYIPGQIGIAADKVDAVRHKKSLNPLDLSF
jgi:hypothetical protein